MDSQKPTTTTNNTFQLLYKPIQINKQVLLPQSHNTSANICLNPFTPKTTVKAGIAKDKISVESLDHPHIAKDNQAKGLKKISNIDTNAKNISLKEGSLGDFIDIITEHGNFSEILTRTLFKQLIDAVSYLHQNNIAHMDLKCENLILDSHYCLKVLVSTDSLKLSATEFENRGTPGYRCPELIKGKSTNLSACDVYSMGVILFILLSGYPPYQERTTNGAIPSYDEHYRLLRRNPNKYWSFHASRKKSAEFFSEDFKALVMKMIEEDPDKRASIKEIRESKWFNGPVCTQEEYVKEMEKYLRA